MAARVRLTLARVLAWTLLLGGWVGIAAFAVALTADALAGYGLIALWLFALGAFASLLGRLRIDPWVQRALLLACAAVAARGLAAAGQGSGLAALLPALLAWALLTALASTTVRALRWAAGRPPAAPVAAAAAGALLAGLALGDAGDLPALAQRLAGLLLAAALLLAVLQPGAGTRPARAGCRAGLFDCSLPAWSSFGWRTPGRWPVLLASLVMLPMMCSLPQVLALCRSAALPAQAVLGIHLAAMFVPALLLRRVLPQWPRAAALACGALLVAGGAAGWLSGPTAWWWLALAHGSAWSLAWAVQLGDARRPGGHAGSPLRAASGHALFALTLGAAIAAFGLQALLALQLALAAAAALALLAAALQRDSGAARPGLPGQAGR